jgi:hypothetical protein
MRLTMARYEIMICDLHEIQMRALDLWSNPTDCRTSWIQASGVHFNNHSSADW